MNLDTAEGFLGGTVEIHATTGRGFTPEELAEMVDPKMIKTLQKEINELKKYQAKAEKMHEKLTKNKSKEVIDEAEPSIEY